MMSRSSRLALQLLAVCVVAFAAEGCSKKSAVTAPKANVRPILELTRAPFDRSTRFEYSYRMNWLGYDPDGRVVTYRYAVDPPAPTAANPFPDTAWVETSKTEHTINFTASQPDTTVKLDYPKRGSSDFHIFVVKAIDNGGLQSVPLSRAFFTFTVAPTCNIISPLPRDGARAFVTPSVRITWTGVDEDGIFDSKKPVKYKYILLNANTPVTFQTALSSPDSVRRYYAPGNSRQAPPWEGWDSTGVDTTTIQFHDLIPGSDYMFCVISFDEAGAYSPIFNMATNMLNFRVSFAAVGGPKLTMFNEFFFYQYANGVFSTLPQYHVPLEIPANLPVTFYWVGEAIQGASVAAYRWALDIEDPSDMTQRSNERTDLKHWSTPSALTTQATVGGFPGGEFHTFYIMAEDDNGLKSLGIIDISVVQSSLARDLGIVDDTRFPVDNRTNTLCMDRPRGAWPSSAELDTFLFARGWFPYKCYPTGIASRPGIFAGYNFDTINTRSGLSEVRVPLKTIGEYKHLIWITDINAATNFKPGTDSSSPICALHYMNTPGRANSVAAYIKQGGEVWFLGSGVAYASTFEYNKKANDLTTPAPGTTFDADPPNSELVPGRMMYDMAHWRSQIKIAGGAPVVISRFLGRFDSLSTPPSPNQTAYLNLPLVLRPKSATLLDSFPPNRTVNFGDFYVSSFACEYMSKSNWIQEETDLNPFVDSPVNSTMDTLYQATGSTYVPPSFNRNNVCMTIYNGGAGQVGMGQDTQRPIIFSGFNIWSFARVDCKGVVDQVLQGLWHLYPTTPPMPMMRMRPVAGRADPWTPPPGVVADGRVAPAIRVAGR